MRRVFGPVAVGVALLLLIPVFVVFTPPVRATWDPAQQSSVVDSAAGRDVNRPAGRSRAGAGVPESFIGSIVTRTALDEVTRRFPDRGDGQPRAWRYAIAGDAWTDRSPLEMTAIDEQRCADDAARDACYADRAAIAHARVIRATHGAAEVEVTWRAAATATGTLSLLLVRDGDIWRVRRTREQGAAPAR